MQAIFLKLNLYKKTSSENKINSSLNIKNYSNTSVNGINWDFHQRLKSLGTHANNLKKYNDELNKSILNLNNQNNNLTLEITSFKKENEILTKEIASLKKSNKGLSNDRDMETKKLSAEISSLKNKNDKLNKEKIEMKYGFLNFQEFLLNSYTSPLIVSPFSDEDKRVFAFMDHLGKNLRKITSNSAYKPLVSVIMPTHNREKIIPIAINSVLNQTYSNFELIIVDDASTDRTKKLLETYDDSRIRVLFHNENKGCSIARNYALKNIKGDIVMYLDSDNEWDSKYIETMVGAFIHLPDADALYSGQLLYKSFNSNPLSVRFGSFNKPLLHNRNYIDLNCFCHKKDVLNKIYGFDEKLWRLSDWDFILRISNNFKMYSVPIILSKYYIHDFEDRIGNIPFNYLDAAEKILEKNKIALVKYKSLSRKVCIIIPSYESLDELKKCMNSIISFTSRDMVDIIVVDNNSSKKVREYLLNLESEGKIYLILNTINYGFTFAVNQGISISNPDSDILILNNDAVLTEGAIEHMQNCAYELPDCGLVVPHEMLINDSKSINVHVPYATPEFECDVTPSRIHHNIMNMPIFHDGGLLELNFAPLFCAYIKRDVYNQTLGLDAELGRHFRSDRIFSDFIRHFLHLKIYQAPHAYVHHKHPAATNKLKDDKSGYGDICGKNQWEPELAEQLGYKNALWDL